MTPLSLPKDANPVQLKPMTPAEQQLEFERKRDLELKLLRERAQSEGREAGYEAGFAAARAEGYAEGLEAGKQEALLQSQEQIRTTLAPLQHLAANFTQALSKMDQEIGEEVAALALKISQMIVGKALKESPGHILELVKQLLHHEPELSGKPKLHLHPSDYTLVKENLEVEIESAGWTLRSDDLITQGGCKVVSKSGDLDATLEARWAQIQEQYEHLGIKP